MTDLRVRQRCPNLRGMKQQQSLVPFFVCFVVAVFSIVIPVVFIRDSTLWMILLGLSPFGILQLMGLYFIVNAFVQKAPDDWMLH